MCSMTTKADTFREVQFSRMLLGLGTFIVLGCAIAVGAVFGPAVRLLVGILGIALIGLLAYRTRLIVVMSDEGLRVTPAHIAWSWVARAEALDEDGMRAALSTEAHPTDYLRIRGTRGGLRLWLSDPSDPHRCWLVSIRDVAALRRALDALRGSGALSAA